ncbi:MAG: ATP-binding cassette domain-containing protein [Granulosicoccus sp.]
MSASNLVTVQSLKGSYGGTPVLQGIDLSNGFGQIIAVIGRNGMGKTTLMQTLVGLVSASSGSIHFDGSDIVLLSANRRARNGIG